MARPIKNSCDYFSHDRDMRNHRKVKALRAKFGINGYAIWSMLLEYLTGSEQNQFKYSDVEFELMAGDFGSNSAEIRAIIDYCLLLELLHEKDQIIWSKSLDERLKPVYDKRERERSNSELKHRHKGVFVGRNSTGAELTDSETPQSKVKESKVKESKVKRESIGPKKNGKKVVVEVTKKGPKKANNKFTGKIEDPFFGKLEKWADWKNYKLVEKKFTFKSAITENQALKNLFELSGGEISKAEKIIAQSIGNGWSGLFELKNFNNKNSSGQNGKGASTHGAVGKTIEFDQA